MLAGKCTFSGIGAQKPIAEGARKVSIYGRLQSAAFTAALNEKQKEPHEEPCSKLQGISKLTIMLP